MNGLPALANNLASQGRYGDSMLMHVSPGEVQGLQALAQSQGTSLTTNPGTGLPEAFKLKDLLPTLAGIGLSFIPGVGPLAAAGMVGGFETIRTGDLGRGLMAGLGAYGGAGLGSALTSAGAAAPGAVASNLGVQGASTGAGSQAAQLAAQNAGFGQAGLEATRQAAATATGANMAPALSSMQLAGQGASNLGSMQGLSNFGTGLQAAFPSTQAKIAAATPAVMGLSETFAPKYGLPTPEDPYANYEGPYTPTKRQVSYPGLEDRMSSREFNYFTPSNPVPFAEGGETKDRSIKTPGADYVGGTSPEFNYGFRPVEIAKAAAPASIGGKGALGRIGGRMFGFGLGENNIVGYTAGGDPIYSRNPTQSSGGLLGRLFGKKEDSGPADMSGYKYDPMTQQMVKMARGGSVPQLEDGGFVLTKKAVDGLGGGDNKQGQQVASMGLGALPIKGKGHGTSDSIKTTIDGKVPARVSNGEAYVPRSKVKQAGGAKKLYALMRKAERKA